MMRKWMIPLVGVSAIALAACGETTTQRTGTGAAGGAVAGAVVGGPVGAVVGAGVGAVAGANRDKIDDKTDKAADATKEKVAEASDKIEDKLDKKDGADTARSADRAPGLTNAQVKDAQTTLKDIGLYDGKVDGIYGKKTIKAVATFQAKNDLPRTGTLTERTRTKLQQVASADGMKEKSEMTPGGAGTTPSTTGTKPARQSQ
jgi:Putative peptidoglycan binding domain/YMGG-like Gly-zipper